MSVEIPKSVTSNMYSPFFNQRGTNVPNGNNELKDDYHLDLDKYRKCIIWAIRKRTDIGEERKSKLIANFDCCGKTYAHFVCADHGKFSSAMGCDLPFCPECATKRYHRFLGRYRKVMKNWKNPKMLTLTKKNTLTLTNADFKKFGANWAMFKRYIKRYNACKLGGIVNYNKEKITFDQGVRVFEVTYHKIGEERYDKRSGKCIGIYNESNAGFHLHMHILYEGSFAKQNVLSRIWQKVTKDSMVVDIRAVKVKSLKSVVRYIGSYMAKGNSFSNYDGLMDVYVAMRQVRIIASFGKMRVKLEKFVVVCPICNVKLVYKLKVEDGMNNFIPLYILETEYYRDGMKIKDEILVTNNVDDVVKAIEDGMSNYFDLIHEFGENAVVKLREQGVIFEPRVNEIQVVK